MEHLQLAGNGFTGPVPPEWSAMASLKVLNLG
jgi:hypothetical protein